MSYGIAAWTRLVGSAQGTFIDDLTNADIGQWPKDLAIRRITSIACYSSAIIDAVGITYELTNGNTTTVRHGGPGGSLNLSIDLAENQKLIAVYGRRVDQETDYGDKNIVQLSFMIATYGSGSEDAATVSVETITAKRVDFANSQFDFTWPLVGATSYTGPPPSGRTQDYLQAIGFSEVFAKSDAPF